jgi:hypothetical protein
MNLKFLYIAFGGLLFSYLFFEQEIGLNTALFQIYILTGLLVFHPKKQKTPLYRFLLAGMVISILSAAWYGSAGCVASSFLITGLFALVSSDRSYSIVAQVLLFMVNLFYGIIHFMLYLSRKWGSENNKPWKKVARLILLSLVPIFVTLVFLSMYAQSNGIFRHWLDTIDLSFISLPWIVFTLFGAVFLSVLLHPAKLHLIANWDLTNTNYLNYTAPKAFQFDTIIVPYADLKRTGEILFILLNALIFFMNISDFIFQIGGSPLPENMNISDYVHQGVGMLILSIVLAISLLLFFFNGSLNFDTNNGLLKRLAYLWIIQNIILVFLTLNRNGMYVEIHGLTYKRIGVFIYLGLALIGLVSTWIKLRKFHTTFWLMKSNMFIWPGVLFLNLPINWNAAITHYNLRFAKHVDFEYLLKCGPDSYPILTKYLTQHPEIDLAQYTARTGTISDDLEYLKKSWQEEKALRNWIEIPLRYYFME